MKILVLNAGSSSLKYQLFDMLSDSIIAKGMCERIGVNGGTEAFMGYKSSRVKEEFRVDMPTHKEAMELVIKTLLDTDIGVIKTINDIDAIGHRVVHGGEFFNKSEIVNESILAKIESLCELAPLHNPPNILGIRTCMDLIKGKPNVVVFDTAFHQTIPEHAFTYAIPYEDYQNLKVRKYGFHGTSHRYVSAIAVDLLKEKGINKDSKVIVCHLGNGSSVSAVKDGKCVDTSMGLTPLEGLMMGTRCGDIDPAAVLFLMEKKKMSAKEMDTYLNKKSGIVGIYKKSSDFRNVRDDMASGDKMAQLTFDMLAYRIKKYIGSYAAALGGVDAICFTGGIGENSWHIRAKACEGLEYMGVDMDIEKNQKIAGDLAEVTKEGSKTKVFVIPTNEELMIAKDTYALIK